MPNGDNHETYSIEDMRRMVAQHDDEDTSWAKLKSTLPKNMVDEKNRIVIISGSMFPIHYHINGNNGFIHIGWACSDSEEIIGIFSGSEFRVGNRFDNMLAVAQAIMRDERGFLKSVDGISDEDQSLFDKMKSLFVRQKRRR